MDLKFKKVLGHWKGQADYVDQWFLMAEPYPISVIVLFYLLFVLKMGSDYMKIRPPFKLQPALVLYNGSQILFSLFLVYNGVYVMMKFGLFNKSCIVDNEEIKKELLSRSYWYLIGKLSELLDTVFFVLRKKRSHVSFLHVYHHTMVVVVSWILIKYSRTDDLVFVGTLNSFVHVFMYAYYGLAAMPRVAGRLWWKKYVTRLQLIQFVLVLIYFPIKTTISTCKPSLILGAVVVINGFLFLYLFLDFYHKSFGRKNKKTAAGIRKKGQVNRGAKGKSSKLL